MKCGKCGVGGGRFCLGTSECEMNIDDVRLYIGNVQVEFGDVRMNIGDGEENSQECEGEFCISNGILLAQVKLMR